MDAAFVIVLTFGLVVGCTLVYIALTALIMVGVLLLFFFLKSKYEEDRLAEQYRAYRHYMTHTKRFLPFIW